MLKENRVHASNLMAPVFVKDGAHVVEPVEAMPGINRYSVDTVSEYVGRLVDQGVRSVHPLRDTGVQGRVGERGLLERRRRPEGHSRAQEPLRLARGGGGRLSMRVHLPRTLRRPGGGGVSNELTLPLLAEAALEYARAGADVVCPSAMMDGQVLAIRKALDDSSYEERLVMGYSAKYASSFYGPFRDAARSAPAFGDRKAYQMSPANSREAMRRGIDSDIREGADIIMVKPALAYLDVISKARRRYDVPLPPTA